MQDVTLFKKIKNVTKPENYANVRRINYINLYKLCHVDTLSKHPGQMQPGGFRCR